MDLTQENEPSTHEDIISGEDADRETTIERRSEQEGKGDSVIARGEGERDIYFGEQVNSEW